MVCQMRRIAGQRALLRVPASAAQWAAAHCFPDTSGRWGLKSPQDVTPDQTWGLVSARWHSSLPVPGDVPVNAGRARWAVFVCSAHGSLSVRVSVTFQLSSSVFRARRHFPLSILCRTGLRAECTYFLSGLTEWRGGRAVTCLLRR